MQKIEKWRLEELALVLNQLSEILREGNHCEWANVFHHFQDESQKILSKKEFDLDSLKSTRACLFKILEDMEKKTIEFIN